MSDLRGVCILALAGGLAACSNESPSQQNVQVQRGELVQRQAALEKPFIEELPKPKQVPEVPEPPAVAKPQISETGSVPVVLQVGEKGTEPVQQPKAGRPTPWNSRNIGQRPSTLPM